MCLRSPGVVGPGHMRLPVPVTGSVVPSLSRVLSCGSSSPPPCPGPCTCGEGAVRRPRKDTGCPRTRRVGVDPERGTRQPGTVLRRRSPSRDGQSDEGAAASSTLAVNSSKSANPRSRFKRPRRGWQACVTVCSRRTCLGFHAREGTPHSGTTAGAPGAPSQASE